MKRTIEIEDTLDDIIESAIDDVETELINYLNSNPDTEDVPDIGDLDYSGAIHEIIDSAVPIYTGEINDLFYLYGNDFEEAFDDAGIGSKDDDWPSGWKPAAIYCYIQEQVYNWYYENAESVFDAWKGLQKKSYRVWISVAYSSLSEWDTINEIADEVDPDSCGAGSGFGYRDIDWSKDTYEEALELRENLIKAFSQTNFKFEVQMDIDENTTL